MRKKYIYIYFYLLILTFFIPYVNVNAQAYDWLAESFPNSYFLGVYKVDGKYYGAVSNGDSDKFDSTTIFQLSIFEINFSANDGLQLQEYKTIPSEDKYSSVSIDYIEETNRWLIVQIKIIESDKRRYRLLLCDEDFNIITEKTKDTIGTPFTFFIDTEKSMTKILGSVFGSTQMVFYGSYSHSEPNNLSNIQIRQTEPNNTFFISSMDINKVSQNMLVFYLGGITELDTNLVQSFRLFYDDINTAFHGTILSIDSNYFSHSLTRQESINQYKFVVLQKYDSLFNILKSDTVGVNGEDNFPFYNNSIDISYDDIIVGGYLDGIYANSNFNTSVKKFYLAKFDLDLNMEWYKEYGGDKAYILGSLKILDEIGIVLYGSVFDSLTGVAHAYILYLDENGNVTRVNEADQKEKNKICLVNPGTYYLHILNPNYALGTIELFDVLGNKVFAGTLSERESKYYVNYLPVGTYTCIIYHQDKLIYNGKWIKSE